MGMYVHLETRVCIQKADFIQSNRYWHKSALVLALALALVSVCTDRSPLCWTCKAPSRRGPRSEWAHQPLSTSDMDLALFLRVNINRSLVVVLLCLPVCASLSIFLSIYLSVSLSVSVSVCLPAYLSTPRPPRAHLTFLDGHHLALVLADHRTGSTLHTVTSDEWDLRCS